MLFFPFRPVVHLMLLLTIFPLPFQSLKTFKFSSRKDLLVCSFLTKICLCFYGYFARLNPSTLKNMALEKYSTLGICRYIPLLGHFLLLKFYSKAHTDELFLHWVTNFAYVSQVIMSSSTSMGNQYI